MARHAISWGAAAVAAAVLGGCATSPDKPIFDALAKADKGWSALPDYERGKRYLAVGDYGFAIEAFAAELQHDPRSIRALNGQAIAYQRIGRSDIAERFLKRALDIDPNSPVTLNNEAYLHLMGGDRAGAVAFVARAKASLASDGGTQLRGSISDVLDANATLIASAAPAAPKPSVPAQLEKTGDGDWVLHAVKTTPVETAALAPVAPATPLPALPDTPVLRLPQGAQQAVAPAQREPHLSAKLMIVNGSGRSQMAHHLQQYLATHGIAAQRLVNARRFDRKLSVVFYHPDSRETAVAVAGAIPVRVMLVELKSPARSVEFVAGSDLDRFVGTLASTKLAKE